MEVGFFLRLSLWNSVMLQNLTAMEAKAGSLPWNVLFLNSIPKFLKSTVVWYIQKLSFLSIKAFYSVVVKLQCKFQSHVISVVWLQTHQFLYVNFFVYTGIICSWVYHLILFPAWFCAGEIFFCVVLAVFISAMDSTYLYS